MKGPLNLINMQNIPDKKSLFLYLFHIENNHLLYLSTQCINSVVSILFVFDLRRFINGVYTPPPHCLKISDILAWFKAGVSERFAIINCTDTLVINLVEWSNGNVNL